MNSEHTKAIQSTARETVIKKAVLLNQNNLSEFEQVDKCNCTYLLGLDSAVNQCPKNV